MHMSSIFLANLVVLQVYGREMAIGAKIGQIGAEILEAEKVRQQASAVVLAS